MIIFWQWKQAHKHELISVSLETRCNINWTPPYTSSIPLFDLRNNALSGLRHFTGVDDEFSHSVNLACYYSSISPQPSLSLSRPIGEASIGLRSDWSLPRHRAVRLRSCTTTVMLLAPPSNPPAPVEQRCFLGCWSNAVSYHQDHKSEWDGGSAWGTCTEDAFPSFLCPRALQGYASLVVRDAVRRDGSTFGKFLQCEWIPSILGSSVLPRSHALIRGVFVCPLAELFFFFSCWSVFGLYPPGSLVMRMLRTRGSPSSLARLSPLRSPLEMRSLSRAMKTVGTGSQVTLHPNHTLNGFGFFAIWSPSRKVLVPVGKRLNFKDKLYLSWLMNNISFRE